MAAYLNIRHCVHLRSKKPFYLFLSAIVVGLSVRTGRFLLLSISSVLIRLLLGAESWPSDIIFPHSPLIKGRNDKNWLCSGRSFPWRVLCMRSSLTARRLAGSVMGTPPAWDLLHRWSSWEYGGGGIVHSTTSKMRHDLEVEHTGDKVQ